jgi:hypothetical protein
VPIQIVAVVSGIPELVAALGGGRLLLSIHNLPGRGRLKDGDLLPVVESVAGVGNTAYQIKG